MQTSSLTSGQLTMRLAVVALSMGASVAWAQPSNETCAGAVPLSLTDNVALSSVVNVLAAAPGVEAPLSCASSARNSIWYSFSVPTTGVYLINTCASETATNFDTALAVYTGTCGGLTQISGACNDDGCGVQSTLQLSLTAGTTVYMQVAAFSSSTVLTATSVAQLQVRRFVPGAGDVCRTAPALELGVPVTTDLLTVNTNDSVVGGNLDGGAGTCFVGVGHSTTPSSNLSPGKDTTYSFDPPTPGRYSFRAYATSSQNSTLYLTDSCVDAVTPPQVYAPPQCIAAANRQFGSSTGAEELACVQVNGLVYLHIDDVSATTTSILPYDLEVTQCVSEQPGNDTPATAGPLACPVTGATAPAGDLDYFDLGTPTAASRVYAMVDALTSGAAGSANNGYDLRVTNDTATLEYDNSDLDTEFGSLSASIAGTPVPAGARAFLQVRQNSATTVSEPYRLYSVLQSSAPVPETEPNDTVAAANANPVNYFSGDISSTADNDLFAFPAARGDVLFLSLDGEPTRTARGLTANLNLELLASDGGVLVSVTDSNTSTGVDAGPTLDSLSPVVPSDALVYRVRRNGVYYARVLRTNSTGHSAYQLSISRNCSTGGGLDTPTVTGVSPATGSVLGSDTVTISGTNITAATTAVFGTAMAEVISFTPTSLTVRTPPGNEGAVDITLTNPGRPEAVMFNAFTYVAPILPPTITSVSPAFGTTLGGTAVTLRGTLFKPGATVTFTVGATTGTATNVSVISALELRATTPPMPAGVASVTVNNTVDMLSGSLANAYIFNSPPALSAVTPTQGSYFGGQTVTLTGQDFLPDASVSFGNTPATGVTYVDSTSLTAVTPAAILTGPVAVTVTNYDGQRSVLDGGYLYRYVAPVVSSITPNFGFGSGGTRVSITGDNFVGVPRVTIGGAEATGVIRLSRTLVTAIAPAGVGVGDVTVFIEDGQSGTLTSAFTFFPPPVVTSIAPATGAAQGGTRVTITGTGFVGPAKVIIGGTPAVAVDVTSSTSLTAVTQAGVPGAADVQVINADTQMSTLPAAYNFEGAPVIAGVSPAVGSTLGGTVVTLSGQGFQTNSQVTFGGQAGTAVTVVSGAQLRVTAPAGNGTVDLVVTTPDGQTTTARSAFRYVAPPTLTAAAPTKGPAAGGTTVRLTGTNFRNDTEVSFGGTPASAVTYVNATTLDAVSPPHLAGAVDISVTYEGIAATLRNAFTYERGALRIDAIGPVAGPSEGGTVVTLTGSGFGPGGTVRFGDVAATEVVVVSDVLVRATTPAHAIGTGDVTFTNTDATTATLSGAFTWTKTSNGNTGAVRDGGSGAVGVEPTPVEVPEGGVSCGCATFDGSLFGLLGVALTVLRSRRRR